MRLYTRFILQEEIRGSVAKDRTWKSRPYTATLGWQAMLLGSWQFCGHAAMLAERKASRVTSGPICLCCVQPGVIWRQCPGPSSLWELSAQTGPHLRQPLWDSQRSPRNMATVSQGLVTLAKGSLTTSARITSSVHSDLPIVSY